MFVPHGEQTHERWDLGRGEEGVGDWGTGGLVVVM